MIRFQRMPYYVAGIWGDYKVSSVDDYYTTGIVQCSFPERVAKCKFTPWHFSAYQINLTLTNECLPMHLQLQVYVLLKPSCYRFQCHIPSIQTHQYGIKDKSFDNLDWWKKKSNKEIPCVINLLVWHCFLILNIGVQSELKPWSFVDFTQTDSHRYFIEIEMR